MNQKRIVEQLKSFNARDFNVAMTATLAQQPAQFSFPVIAPSVDADGLYPQTDDIGESQRNDGLRHAHISEARAWLMFDPIAAAKPWTPGMGRVASAHQLAAGIER